MTATQISIPDIESLNQQFAIDDGTTSLCFKKGKGELPVIEIKNQQASAVITLQGAYVLSWIPAGQPDVIWVSKDASFAVGKSIRGGIPICWPWFGAHEEKNDFPAHGFARTVFWQMVGTQVMPGGETRVDFRLDTTMLDEKHLAMWPHATIAEYHMTIGKTLKLELTTCNKSKQPIQISEALHTYFNVQDVTSTTVSGLEDVTYLDKMDAFKRKKQTGVIRIDTAVDRVYVQTKDDVIIDCPQRKIHIEKEGSSSTVVWNPWKEIAEKMGDLGNDGYMSMLCVETANAADDTITIQPGDCHTLKLSYQVQ